MFHFANFVLGAFAGVDIGNMQNRFLFGIQNLHNFIGIATRIKVITDVELFEILIAVELFVIGVFNGFKFGFVFGVQDGDRITTKVRASHRHNMDFVPCHQLTDIFTEFVVGICGNMVKFINGN